MLARPTAQRQGCPGTVPALSLKPQWLSTHSCCDIQARRSQEEAKPFSCFWLPRSQLFPRINRDSHRPARTVSSSAVRTTILPQSGDCRLVLPPGPRSRAAVAYKVPNVLPFLPPPLLLLSASCLAPWERPGLPLSRGA